VVLGYSGDRGQRPESLLLTGDLASQLCFGSEEFDIYFLSPEQFRHVGAWVGSVRAKTFRRISPHGPSEVDLDGRDNHYWHLLVWDREKQALAGSLRMALSGWRLRPPDGSSSYLEHCYPGLDAHLRAGGMAYTEIGRTFVSRPYQRSTPVLMVLLQAMVSIPRANGHSHLLGMVSYNHFATPEALNQDYLAALLQPPFRDWLWVPPPRHPLDLPPAAPLQPRPENLLRLERDLADRYQIPFRGPVLLRRYFDFGNSRVVGLSLAKDFNQITEILVHCDMETLRPRQLLRLLVDPLQPVWERELARSGTSRQQA
jgi:hypothetical protein